MDEQSQVSRAGRAPNIKFPKRFFARLFVRVSLSSATERSNGAYRAGLSSGISRLAPAKLSKLERPYRTPQRNRAGSIGKLQRSIEALVAPSKLEYHFGRPCEAEGARAPPQRFPDRARAANSNSSAKPSGLERPIRALAERVRAASSSAPTKPSGQFECPARPSGRERRRERRNRPVIWKALRRHFEREP